MSYNDFWFIETRNQSVNLRRWFLWGILLFAFVTVGTVICVKSMYQPIEKYEIQAENPIVKVDEAKRTNANGYIKGTINNPNNEELKGEYIKFEFYTKNDVNIGNEYVEIGTLNPEETKTYELKFKYPNVERFIVKVTDSKD